jgi:hypothetical protein
MKVYLCYASSRENARSIAQRDHRKWAIAYEDPVFVRSRVIIYSLTPRLKSKRKK